MCRRRRRPSIPAGRLCRAGAQAAQHRLVAQLKLGEAAAQGAVAEGDRQRRLGRTVGDVEHQLRRWADLQVHRHLGDKAQRLTLRGAADGKHGDGLLTLVLRRLRHLAETGGRRGAAGRASRSGPPSR